MEGTPCFRLLLLISCAAANVALKVAYLKFWKESHPRLSVIQMSLFTYVCRLNVTSEDEFINFTVNNLENTPVCDN